jgi:hypothetical protein
MPSRTQRFSSRLGIPLLLIGLSFGVYLLGGGGVLHPLDQVSSSDPSEYRYAAEQFFGVPHDLESYAPYFKTQWPLFLETVPFREIGLGTLFLLTNVLSGGQAMLALPLLAKLLLAGSSLLFFAAVRKRYGTAPAAAALAVVVLPVIAWTYTDALVTEAYARMLFLCCLSLAVASRGHVRNATIAVTLPLTLLLTHLKVQWLLFGFILFGALAFLSLLEHHWGKALLAMLSFVLLPLTVSLVHWIGWHDARVNPGISLHVMHKSWGEAREAACQRTFEERPPAEFCNRPFTVSHWVDFANGLPAGEIATRVRALDATALPYLLSKPTALIVDLARGVFYATNFPFLPRPWNFLLKPVDLLCWIVLALGLTRRRTFLFAVLGLGMWIVPAVGTIFGQFDDRYQIPAAGVVLALALLILLEEHRTAPGGLPGDLRKFLSQLRQRWAR